MTDIPVSLNDLDSIVFNVARDLIEERTINGSLDGVTEETTRYVVNDVAFIINRYMYYINEIMDNEKLNDSKKIETQLNFE